MDREQSIEQKVEQTTIYRKPKTKISNEGEKKTVFLLTVSVDFLATQN